MRYRSIFAIGGISALVACSSQIPQPQAGQPSSNPPPAASGIDHTVSIRWQLADSFDIASNGSCTGRSMFRHMGADARVLLRGKTTGITEETHATARVENLTNGRSAASDDGLYCVIRAVFSPALPDPDGYWLRFPGNPRPEMPIGPLNTELGPPFYRGQPVVQATLPPGYGQFNMGSQSCPSLLDPPDRDCFVSAPVEK